MDAHFFLKGMVIGFSIAAPVGPIGVLCIRRSLADGAWVGFSAGLGAATADAAYGCVAGFGLSAISSFLIAQQHWVDLFGGAFLCYLGLRTFLSRPGGEAAAGGRPGFLAAWGSTFLLTLANPATLLSFVAVFAALGIGRSASHLAAVQLVVGVFLGSALWWIILSNGVGFFRSRMNSAWMRGINRISGGVLLAFGLYAMSRG
jgi:threonine/homoserine/homoserine lactone efflux protein